MGLLDSILGAASGKTDASGEANPLIGILGGLLAQSGGLQGLANKFSQSGCGGVFASWVGMGENQSISSDQIQKALGSQQVQALAAKMGIDPAQGGRQTNTNRQSRPDGGPPAGLGRADPIAPAKCRWFAHVALFLQEQL